jgi:anhydro-N-acetylmuramic acid kinase
VRTKSLIVAGVMSGTSADGVDVALCRIAPGARETDPPRVKLLGHAGFPYSKAVRAELLHVMEGEALPAAEFSRLNWRLGEIYADCVARTSAQFGAKIDLVGCHGQTVHHDAAGVKYLGTRLRSTWQMGEPAVIAERLRCPVISDFRPADLAAGGQGAPLVPMVDWCIFRSAKVSRVLLNLGGIANLTALPAACTIEQVLAFDTGPANMVIDRCMQQLFSRPLDRNGLVARRGKVLRGVVEKLMCDTYFSALPPKSCGREQFGAAYTSRLIAMCRAAGGSDSDCVATGTALTAESVVDAYRRFVWIHLGSAAPLSRVEVCVAGGGARNPMLMRLLAEQFAEIRVKVLPIDDLGMPAQAKEGVAFALLAWLTWNRQPGNIPAATGAARPVVLGKVSYG